MSTTVLSLGHDSVHMTRTERWGSS